MQARLSTPTALWAELPSSAELPLSDLLPDNWDTVNRRAGNCKVPPACAALNISIECQSNEIADGLRRTQVPLPQ
jgi:hypothetical protein